MSRNRMDILSFGRELVESGDLDPLYIVLVKTGLSKASLHRWLLAYWFFYHPGLCCWILDCGKQAYWGKQTYWDKLKEVADGGTVYPRGTERRHFRGNLAKKSIACMREDYRAPSSLVSDLSRPVAGPTGPVLPAREVCRRVRTLYGFGDWVMWKVADMLERLGIAPVTFSPPDLSLMFRSSKEGAYQCCDAIGKPKRLITAHRYVLEGLDDLLAPPLYDRPLNVQETETIFCKWHSHLNGHYPIGKDVEDIAEGLHRYAPDSPTASAMLHIMKEEWDVEV